MINLMRHKQYRVLKWLFTAHRCLLAFWGCGWWSSAHFPGWKSPFRKFEVKFLWVPVGTTFSFWIMLTAFYLSLSVLPCLSSSSAPPRFTKVPVDQIGVSGGVVSFVCQATGDPKPRVSWNKKGKKVNSQRIEVSQWAPLEGQLYGVCTVPH